MGWVRPDCLKWKRTKTRTLRVNIANNRFSTEQLFLRVTLQLVRPNLTGIMPFPFMIGNLESFCSVDEAFLNDIFCHRQFSCWDSGRVETPPTDFPDVLCAF